VCFDVEFWGHERVRPQKLLQVVWSVTSVGLFAIGEIVARGDVATMCYIKEHELKVRRTIQGKD
jgi:hypothetical protein